VRVSVRVGGEMKEDLKVRLAREFAEKFEAARGPEPAKITEEERRRRVEQRANLLMQAALRKMS